MSNSYVNNHLYEGEWKAPFKLVHEQPLHEGRAYGQMRCVGGRLFTSAGSSHLVCIEPESKSIVWEITPDQRGFAVAYGSAEHFFTNIGFAVARLDFDTGESIWTGDEKETLYATGDARVFTAVSSKEDAEVRCRSAEAGDMEWATPLPHGYVNEIVTNVSSILVSGQGYLTALDAATGAVKWSVDSLQWSQTHRPEQAAEWIEYHKASHMRSPTITLGPLDERRLFLSFNVGVVVALDVETGDVLWMSEFPNSLESAHTMIFRNDRLYFNRNQLMGTTSYLSCVDADSGALVFRHEEDFTPGGCSGAIMLDSLFLGGSEGHVAAFDVDTEEFVWRHREKRSAAFTGRPCAVSDGFAATCRSRKALLWYGPK